MRIPTATALALGCMFLEGGPARQPIKMPFERSAAFRWLQKPVLESRPLDGMEDLATWQSFTQGADAVVVKGGAVDGRDDPG